MSAGPARIAITRPASLGGRRTGCLGCAAPPAARRSTPSPAPRWPGCVTANVGASMPRPSSTERPCVRRHAAAVRTTRANLTAGHRQSSEGGQAPSLSQSLPRGECRTVDALLARFEQGRGQRRRWGDGRDRRGQSGRPYQRPGGAREGEALPGEARPARLHPQRERKGKAAGHSSVGRQARATGLCQAVGGDLRGRLPRLCPTATARVAAPRIRSSI